MRKRNLDAKQQPATPLGPQEVTATDWLADRPSLTEQIATVPYRLDRKE